MKQVDLLFVRFVAGKKVSTSSLNKNGLCFSERAYSANYQFENISLLS